MRERVDQFRRRSSEIGSKVVTEVKGDLTSPITTLAVWFRGRRNRAIAYSVGSIFMLEGLVVAGINSGSLETAAIMLAVQYASIGTAWNHQDITDRVMQKVFGPPRNGINHSQ